ncbi:hypothetical protein NUU61_009337 [Penicillium alfredii]|uniref:Protein artemis n=1 Tax=Penicillium alfredii TaxID=1506179 RepID=A0A9W9EMU6_9EURO|nr:uncharacterized protein NUU61_009337 [Penicillium alfredii]KAJ5084758.1 hypothetical protein NUU61_009337 [Penicillium alfredii]
MSTFDGVVEGRVPRDSNDHLQGLESFRAPFLYCSPATRELLLRIEKYPHRMNFNKGILESRRLHYKHLAKLLRPIPLNTPTEIELTPRQRIRVTLFDANHCTGAVMFLIEGNGNAILYTGDIRAEPWWVNSLVRRPVLIPYTLGRKRLDKLYLDTTFACVANPFREFPSKAEGLAELFQKMEAYPKENNFYFCAWTFGYEDVWIALSAALNTKIHVDRYQMGLYRSLAHTSGSRGVSEAPALCGFELGNSTVAGCLSNDENSRIHSCEPGTSCHVARSLNTVYIVPIVNRTADGAEVPEVGAGGGTGDLYQIHELELPDEAALAELEKLCFQHIHDEQALSQMRTDLLKAYQSRRQVLSLDSYGVKEEEEISLEKLVTMLSRGAADGNIRTSCDTGSNSRLDLPNTIRFPYSRHSSYSELCQLVAALRPKDIHPCTVDSSSWSEKVSIGRLFGHLCSGDEFTHDDHMRKIIADSAYEEDLRPRKKARYEIDVSTQSTQEFNSLSTTDPGEQGRNVNQDLTRQIGEFDGEPESPLHRPQPQLSPPRNTSSVQAPTINPSKHLDVGCSTPATARAKRNEIRRAHRYLHDHAEPGLFQIGPLPSSWPTDAEDGFEEEEEEEEAEQDRAIQAQNTSHDSLATIHTESDNYQGSDTDIAGNITTSQSPDHQQPNTQPAESQHTDPLSLSISESVLASPPLDQGSSHAETQSGLGQAQISARAHARARARVAAYLAAREDTYSAWTEVSLVSVENNHAEEEIEL